MHVHNANPEHGAVCSHLVSNDMLRSWGFAIRVPLAGEHHDPADEIVATKARMAAWGQGRVRICTVLRGRAA